MTAGFGDVGFAGYWTLEIFCIHPIRIYPGVGICQIYYHTLAGDYDPYRSGKYQNNTGIRGGSKSSAIEKARSAEGGLTSVIEKVRSAVVFGHR